MPSEVICSEAENLKEFCYQMHARVNSLTPMSNQDRISPYNINTISTRYVMRIKRNINLGIII